MAYIDYYYTYYNFYIDFSNISLFLSNSIYFTINITTSICSFYTILSIYGYYSHIFNMGYILRSDEFDICD